MTAWVVIILVLGAPHAAPAGVPVVLTRDQVTEVFISSTEPTALSVRLGDGTARRILTVRQLPRTSREGFGMDARRFIDASLAPDRSHVAFSTLGIVHGMLGILTLKTGKVRVLAGFFEGYADEIAWSPNGRFVAVTDYGPSGLREIQVYNVQTAVAAERLGLVLEQRFMRRDLEVYRPLWSPDGTRVRFSVLALNRTPADRSQAWEIRLNGTGLRRLK